MKKPANTPDVSRRRFLTQAAIVMPAGAALLSAALTGAASAQAPAPNAPLAQLDVNDPTAKALLYVEDAAKVDRKNPLAARFTPDQKCSSCSQIQGKAGDAHRPCAIFPGKLVASNGWCSVWAKKG